MLAVSSQADQPTLAPESTVTDASMGAARAGEDFAPVRVGDAVGRYTIVDRKGAGAMGVVYAAYDPNLDRRVALKLLHPGRARTEKARTRLWREAQALAKLAHPNVVAVHDVGKHGDEVFVAMEFVQGQTLGAWMKTPRAWKEVLRLMVLAGRGLAAAHAAGLVHRDFKPENVMVGDDGRVKVMDLGLVRASASSMEASSEQSGDAPALATDVTDFGRLLGTPSYMAPEQFAAREADARSDQFAFCVVLYEALYGVRPFPGKTVPELATRITHDDPQPPPSAGRVPSWLDQAVRRGLSKDPADRFPSMEALLGALDRTPSRNRWWTTGALGVAGVVAAGAWGYARSEPEPCPAPDASTFEAWSPRARSEVTASLASTATPFAEQTATAVGRALDRYASRWGDARQDACVQTRVRGEQSQSVMDLRYRCLDRLEVEFAALVDRLREADVTVAERAVRAAASLQAPDRCEDPDFYGADILPPPPNQAEAVAALRRTLADAKSLGDTGLVMRGKELAQGVVPDAIDVGYAPVVAQAHLLLAELLVEQEDYDAATPQFQAAYTTAATVDDPRLTYRAALGLATTVGSADLQQADFWAGVARAHIERGTWSRPDEAQFHAAMARLRFESGDYVQGIEVFDTALALLVESGEDGTVLGAELQLEAAEAILQMSQVDRAEALIVPAAEVLQRELGDKHPLVARALASRAFLSEMKGNSTEAVALYQGATDIYAEVYGARDRRTLTHRVDVLRTRFRHAQPRPPISDYDALMRDVEAAGGSAGMKADLESLRGAAYSKEGNEEGELGSYRRAVEYAATLPEESPLRGIMAWRYGRSLLRHERYEDAIEPLRVAFAVGKRTMQDKQPRIASPTLPLAEALGKSGHVAEAIEVLQGVIEGRARQDPAADDVALMRLALARWIAARGDLDDAAELARTVHEQATSSASAEWRNEADYLVTELAAAGVVLD